MGGPIITSKDATMTIARDILRRVRCHWRPIVVPVSRYRCLDACSMLCEPPIALMRRAMTHQEGQSKFEGRVTDDAECRMLFPEHPVMACAGASSVLTALR